MPKGYVEIDHNSMHRTINMSSHNLAIVIHQVKRYDGCVPVIV